jgi:hypothetical protein
MNAMNAGETRPEAPMHLWIVGILALLWNAMGAWDYLATELRLEAYMEGFTEEQLAYFYGFPSWVVAFWAIAVWGSLLASIGLLLRRKWSVWAFGVSFVALVVTSIYNFGLSNGAEVMGSTGVIFSVVIWIISILLLVYACWLSRRGVLV